MTYLIINMLLYMQTMLSFSGVHHQTNLTRTDNKSVIQFTYSKVYLVTDEDYNILKDEVGVPKDYDQLSLCENDSQQIIDQIEKGINTAFTKGTLMPWCYTVPGGNPHCHEFIKVPKSCNKNVQQELQQYSDEIIYLYPYEIQLKNPPHVIGKSSWSIIFSDQKK